MAKIQKLICSGAGMLPIDHKEDCILKKNFVYHGYRFRCAWIVKDYGCAQILSKKVNPRVFDADTSKEKRN